MAVVMMMNDVNDEGDDDDVDDDDDGGIVSGSSQTNEWSGGCRSRHVPVISAAYPPCHRGQGLF